MIPAPTQVWLVVEPIDMRAGIDSLSQRIQTTLGRSPCDGSAYAFHNNRRTRIKLRLLQSFRQSHQASRLGWHGGVALSSAPASRPFHLAHRERDHLHAHGDAMAMADYGRRLAAIGCRAPGALAGVIRHAKTIRKIST